MCSCRDNQPRLTIPFLDYPDESDLDGGMFPNGNYPIPPNMPIESWPKGTGSLSLLQWQMDVNNNGGDQHGIMVAPGLGSFWETWQMKLTQSDWQASNGAKFDLNANALRPAGWTSGDAAGLPMFPAVPRFDECERGMVEHAMRLAVAKTRREYIYPAVHYASSIPASSTNYPAMGQRLRLKASVVIPSNWTTEEKAILLGLKKSLRSQHEQTWRREAVQNRQVLFRWGLAPRDSSSFRPRASPFDTARVRGEPCQTDRRRPCGKLQVPNRKESNSKSQSSH